VQSARHFVAGPPQRDLEDRPEPCAPIALALRTGCRECRELALRPDANASLQAPSAAAFLRQLQEAGVEAIEQPLPPWDLQGMAELARRLDVPLIADESVCTPTGLAPTSSASARRRHSDQGREERRRMAHPRRSGKSPRPRACASIPAIIRRPASPLLRSCIWQRHGLGTLEAGPYAVGINGTLAADVVTSRLPSRTGPCECRRGRGSA
jgi:hypothetical protein